MPVNVPCIWIRYRMCSVYVYAACIKSEKESRSKRLAKKQNNNSNNTVRFFRRFPQFFFSSTFSFYIRVSYDRPFCYSLYSMDSIFLLSLNSIFFFLFSIQYMCQVIYFLFLLSYSVCLPYFFFFSMLNKCNLSRVCSFSAHIYSYLPYIQ